MFWVATLGLAALCFAPTQAHAGAWTLDKGHGLTIITADLQSANTFYDPAGDTLSGLSSSKSELRAYGEYGVANGTTVIFNSGYQATSLSGLGGVDFEYTGYSNIDLGVRQRLYKTDRFVVSAQGLLSQRSKGYSLPGAPINLANSGLDAELRLMGGHSWELRSAKGFSDVQLGVRAYAGGSTSTHLDITAGIEPYPDWLLMAQGFAVSSKITDPKPTYDNFENIRLQPSLVYSLSPTRRIQIGAYRSVYGRASVQEGGAFAALWYKY